MQIKLARIYLRACLRGPGALAYDWLGGNSAGQALDGNQSAINYGLIALALLAAVALLPRLIRRLRGDDEPKWIEIELLASWLKDGAGVILIDVRGPDEFTVPRSSPERSEPAGGHAPRA